VTSVRTLTGSTAKVAVFCATAVVLLWSQPCRGESLPRKDQIDALAQTTRQTVETFMQRSFKLRMMYEYSPRFWRAEDKAELKSLSETARQQLRRTADDQSRLKQVIEDYEGDDWDARYGETGLWRKLAAQLYATELACCRVDFWRALTAEQPERQNILQDILTRLESLERISSTPVLQLLRARVLGLSSSGKIEAVDILGSLTTSPGVPEAIYFRAAIEQIRLVRLSRPRLLEMLAEKLARSGCAADFEIVIPLAIQRHRYDPNAFKKTIYLWPQTKEFLGSLILSDLNGRFEAGRLTEQHISRLSRFDVSLVAEAIRSGEPAVYRQLLGRLVKVEKFRTPLVLYVTAAAFEQDCPQDAVNYLVEASRIQQSQGDRGLGLDTCRIAADAARLAYDLWLRDANNCGQAVEAFENYDAIAGGQMDEDIEYRFTAVLDSCGRGENARALLKKIAGRASGKWAIQAKLELILGDIEQGNLQPDEALLRLAGLIDDCKGQADSQTKTRALTAYCRLLLERNDQDSLLKIVAATNDPDVGRAAELLLLRSKALWKLDRPKESIDCLLEIIGTKDEQYTAEIIELLAEMVGALDKLQCRGDDFDGLLAGAGKVAEYCERIASSQAGPSAALAQLYLAEIRLFGADTRNSDLSPIAEMLEGLEKDGRVPPLQLLRCRARLAMARGDFEEAAALWHQLCLARKSEAQQPDTRSEKWWRAKYYELYCWSKSSASDAARLRHTIEVLRNTYVLIPAFWASKLDSLERQYRQQ